MFLSSCDLCKELVDMLKTFKPWFENLSVGKHSFCVCVCNVTHFKN